jgi:hypothetical protein
LKALYQKYATKTYILFDILKIYTGLFTVEFQRKFTVMQHKIPKVRIARSRYHVSHFTNKESKYIVSFKSQDLVQDHVKKVLNFISNISNSYFHEALVYL